MMFRRLLKKIISEEVQKLNEDGRGRPKKGMASPKLPAGTRVKLKFSTQEKNKDSIYKNTHGEFGRIYDIVDTDRGKFYVVRLFVARRGDNGAVDKLYDLTDS